MAKKAINLVEIFEGYTTVMLYDCSTGKYTALDTRAEMSQFLVAELKRLLGDENVVYG
jgi:hypothetical protein